MLLIGSVTPRPYHIHPWLTSQEELADQDSSVVRSSPPIQPGSSPKQVGKYSEQAYLRKGPEQHCCGIKMSSITQIQFPFLRSKYTLTSQSYVGI